MTCNLCVKQVKPSKTHAFSVKELFGSKIHKGSLRSVQQINSCTGIASDARALKSAAGVLMSDTGRHKYHLAAWPTSSTRLGKEYLIDLTLKPNLDVDDTLLPCLRNYIESRVLLIHEHQRPSLLAHAHDPRNKHVLGPRYHAIHFILPTLFLPYIEVRRCEKQAPNLLSVATSRCATNAPGSRAEERGG